jgi:outer membrane receptor protein involved in Fe transport
LLKYSSRFAGVSLCALSAAASYAQGAPDQAAANTQTPVVESSENVEEIVVTGSQIRGARETLATPLEVFGAEQIQAVAAVSGADLFRSIPQLGATLFNEQAIGGVSANAARGDVSSISLRGLGQGNTLVLINGRRTVLHPTSQAVTGVIDSGVPTFGYNSNALPVGAIDRVEVLLDGAAALYGSDAVAGVVNNVLNSSFEGVRLDGQFGGAEGTNLREWTVNALLGTKFAGGRGHVTLFGGYARRSRLFASDQPYTAIQDRRPLVAGTPFENNAAFNSTSTSTAWGTFRAAGTGTITSNGIAFTNSSRQFHIQPNTNAGCRIAAGTPGTCYDIGNGAAQMANVDANLRLDAVQTFPGITTLPQVNRFNIFSFVNYELTEGLEFFGEAGVYGGRTDTTLASGGSLANIPITVAANAYWNPLGPVGSPNRLPGLNIPAEGLPVTINALNYIDAGPRRVTVNNYQYRLLGGLKGEFGNWHWETAGLYSWATASDVTDGLSNTALQAAINRTTPDAYNPFNGGSVTTPNIGDGTPNPQAIIDTFRITSNRRTKTTLALWDLRVSNNKLLGLWGGNSIGVAAGIEYRRESFRDDRDPRQGGVAGQDITYTDSVTGIFYGSDLAGASPSPDVSGSRNVKSAYIEFAIPLTSPGMGIPLLRSLDVQVAGRFEDYSDVGSVARPKVALAWELFKGLTLRGSWSQGFRAPNLEVINTAELDRVQGGIEYVLCEADLRAGRITSFAQCNRNQSVLRRSGGNPDLVPEESDNWSVGGVLRPPLPDGWGDLTINVDRWKIKQKNVVGQIDFQNVLNLDYLARVQGSTFPDVVRAAPTADDIAIVAGTGLAPVGELQFVRALFQNLQPITVEGLDINVDYRVDTGRFGKFSFNTNIAKLIRFDIGAPAPVQALLDAQAAGTINAGVPILGGGSVIGQDGQPRWRITGQLNWTLGNLTIGTFGQFIDRVFQNAVRDANANRFVVGSQTTFNAFVQYNFDRGALEGTRFTIGARNIFDKDPPLASLGYLAQLYVPQGRYWYTSISKTF